MSTDEPRTSSGRNQPHQIFILTAPIGGGHSSAAEAVAEMVNSLGRAATVVSPLKEAGWLSRLPTVYHNLSTQHPIVWAAYYYARRTRLMRSINRSVVRRRLIPALDVLKLDRGDTVVLTHSIFCHCIPELRQRQLTVIVLVTDLFGGPLEWFQPGANRYIVPTEEMWRNAIVSGISPSRIALRRLPVLKSGHAPQPRLSHQPPHPRILLVGGSEGAGPVTKITNAMMALTNQFALTVACGRNQHLKDELVLIGDSRLQVEGYIEKLKVHIHSYNLVISKPGSVTLMELLDARIQFFLMPGIAGIERANTRKVTAYLGVPVLRRRRDIKRMLAIFLAGGAASRDLRSRIMDGIDRLTAELPSQMVGRDDLE